jgi:hypothetical protein
MTGRFILLSTLLLLFAVHIAGAQSEQHIPIELYGGDPPAAFALQAAYDPGLPIYDAVASRVRNWPDPAIPYAPFPTQGFRLAGDVTGTGGSARINVYLGVPDPNADQPGPTIHRTHVFFSGNLTSTPDQIVPVQLLPLGDMNGDGYADAIGVNTANQRTWWRGSPTGYVNTGIAAPFTGGMVPRSADFDGDGRHDLVANNNNFLTVHWGHGDFVTITQVSSSYELAEQVTNFVFEIAFFGGEPHYLLHRTLGQPRLDIKRISRTGFEMVQSISLPAELPFTNTATRIAVGDINGNGREEIVFHNWSGGGDVRYLARPADGAIFSSTTQVLFPAESQGYPVGDLDGDGLMDFVSFADARARIHFGGSLNSTPVEVPHQAGDRVSYVSYPLIPGGSISRSGRADLMLGLSRAEDLGGRIVSVSPGREFVAHDNTLRRDEVQGELIAYLTNVGDVNGDGRDDWATVSSRTLFVDGRPVSRNTVSLRSGSDLGVSPFRSYFADGQSPASVIAGDFNGDGHRDVAILWRQSLNSPGGLAVHLGPELSPTPSYEFSYADVLAGHEQPNTTNQGLQQAVLAGDINGDGFDDILLTVGDRFGADNSGRTFVKLGGPDLSATASIALHLGVGGLYPGGTMLSVGRRPGSQYDDVLIGNGNNVFLFYGRVSAQAGNVWQPDRTFAPVAEQGVSAFGFGTPGLAVGDFTGDGRRDLVIPLFSRTRTGNLGAPNLHVFEAFDDRTSNEPDYLVGIPWSAFPQTTANLGSPYAGVLTGQVGAIPGAPGTRDIVYLAAGGSINGAALLLAYRTGTLTPVAVLRGENQFANFGPLNTFLSVRYTSAIGDFSGDGFADIITIQGGQLYVDTPLYRYTIDQVAVNVEPSSPEVADSFTLHGNYPNPFNPSTSIVFDLRHAGQVRLTVYDMLGRAVLQAGDQWFAPGTGHAMQLDGSALPSGTYFYRMTVSGGGQPVHASGRMVLVK